MLQIKKVLFPTDQSACAEQALAQATYLADWHEAELHALSVVETETFPPRGLDELELSDEDIAEQLHLLWEGGETERKEDALPSLTTEQMKAPSAAEGILHYAGQNDIDLIVMGTHGRRGARRLLMGSVAAEVVRRAECPVYTLRAKEHESSSTRTVRRVLAPVDFSDFTEMTIDYAVELAQTYGARVDLLHVVENPAYPEPYGAEPMGIDLGRLKEGAYEGLEELVREEIGYEDVRVDVEIGHPASLITDYADAHDIDLIVIPTHGRSGLKRLLMGSVAEKVVRRAPCPVFTVKSFGKSLLPSVPRRVAEA